MAQYRQPVGYGLSEALPNLSPFPVQAKRAPTTADKGYIPGTLWAYTTASQVYVLASIVNNLATWLLLETGGGAGVFASLTVNPGPTSLTGATTITGTLTSTGATTLATTGASVNTFGNTTGATSVGISSGTAGTTLTSTGQILLTSSLNLADAIQLTATGANGGVSFDSLLGGFDFNTTGPFTVATATGTVGISADAAATTVNLATGAGVKTTTLGSTNTTSTTTVQSGSGALNITATGGALTLNSGVGALGLSTDAAATTVSLATGAGVKTVTLGSTNTTSTTTVQSGSGALNVTATGGALTINSGVGALGVSTDASATAVSLGTGAAAKTVIVGSTTAGSTLTLKSPALSGVTIASAAIPAGLGIFVGAGDPNTVVTAPIGSLYLNSTGSGIADRLWVNTNAGTAWTNFVSAA